MPQPLKWEKIDSQHERAKIAGGWLVKAYQDVFVSLTEDQRPQEGYAWQVTMCFVPDLLHLWE